MCLGCLWPSSYAKVSEETPNKRILVLDCDDTLYRNGGLLAKAMKNNKDAFLSEKLKLDADTISDLYNKHGTGIRGLIKEGLITEEQIDDYLEFVHTFPNEGRDLIKRDEKLRQFLLKVPIQKFIFTAGTQRHAERCCRALGVEDLLISDSRPIIDTVSIKLKAKYEPQSYETCIRMMSEFLKVEVDPKDLIFVDDNLKTVQCAKKNGWGVCILMGVRTKTGGERTTPIEGVDYVVEHLSELEHLKAIQDVFS